MLPLFSFIMCLVMQVSFLLNQVFQIIRRNNFKLLLRTIKQYICILGDVWYVNTKTVYDIYEKYCS